MIFHNLNTVNLSINLTQMYLTSINTDKASRLQNSAMTYKFLIDIYTQSEQGISAAERKFENNSLLYAKRYIEQFYATNLTQTEIAQSAGITPQHLCRLFHKYIHMTPINYLNHIQIEHAKYMLRATSLPVSRICEKVGYATPHYFSTVFHRMENKTPTEYREIARRAASN